VSSFRNDVPPQLQRTIAGLLHKDRAARWSDTAQFLAQLPAASIAMPDLAVRKRETVVEVPPSADSPTLRYQRAAAEVADTPAEPIEQKELPELPAAAVLVTPPEAEPEPAPVREPRPFEAPRPTRLKRRLPGRSYIVPDAAPVLAAATASVPAAIAATEVMPSRPTGIAARALSFAHVTKPRSRLVAATTVLLVLGASATVVAMIGRDKDPDLRANGSPIGSSALTALSPGKKPIPSDSLRGAQPALEQTLSATQRSEEKAAEPRDESDEAKQTNDEPVKPPSVDVPSKSLAKSVPATVIPTFEPPAATASEPGARDFKLLGNEPSKTSDKSTRTADTTIERTPENIDAAPVFTPYTIKPELRNRDAVQRSLSRNYPRRLREAGIGGTVMVWALVDESGKVLKSQVKDGSGIEVLDEAALKVADAMRFTPALNRDQKVRVWIELPLVFKAE
jgi:TonB family protein